MQVVWFKRDLRLRDHEPLRQAFACADEFGPVLPLYVHEPTLIARADFSAQHGGFVRETLDELGAEFSTLGGHLLELVGEAVETLERVWQVAPFSRLWAYQETTTLAGFARDSAVGAWCRAKGVRLVELPQNGVSRGGLSKSSGLRFKEHLSAACEEQLFTPALGLGLEKKLASRALATVLPPEATRGRGLDKPGRLRGGRVAAQACLDDFVRLAKLREYATSISSPLTALAGCSRLSPYLAFGVLSDREVFQRLNDTIAEAHQTLGPAGAERLQSGVQFFAERIYWRSAYLQSMESHPESEVSNDLPAFDGVREAEFHAPWLEAWQAGRTGYPMVDAVMRMLASTGWTNMRMRGMVASFAVNELWLPWQIVGMHLAREFLDYEPGIHWSQMAIHSGSSRLSGPLTYNTVKQARDHDSQGVFVRRWLPELAGVPVDYIFEPWTMPLSVQHAVGCVIGRDYAAPVVRHTVAHDAARERVSALREGRAVPKLQYWKTREVERFHDKQGRFF